MDEIVNENRDRLVSQAENAVASFNMKSAIEYYETALICTPNDTTIIDALADVYLQTADIDKAKTLLEKSTKLAPTENPCKWLFLAQLNSGFVAIDCYNAAVKYLKERLIVTPEEVILFGGIFIAIKSPTKSVTI